MNNIKNNHKQTIFYAAKIFVVYLKTVPLEYFEYLMYLRGLRHILCHFGYDYPLENFNGKHMIQFADVYDPFSQNKEIRERGEVFWKLMFFLKKNEMIPSWEKPEERAG